MKRAQTNLTEAEDPILALLKLEAEEEKVVVESSVVSSDLTINSKIEIESNQESKQPKPVESTTPRKGRPILKKGGLFKAPPSNLIESLLLEDSQE